VTRETEEVRRTRGSVTVGGGILLSRVAGLVRERVFAHFFGASPFADAWRAALRMPNVLQNLLGEGTLSASFIPIYAGMEEEGRRDAARRFAGAVFGLLTATAGLMALLGVLLAPVLVAIFFAGFDPDRQAVTVGLVRILFPMTAVLVLSAWCLGILNSHRRFFLSYAAPVLWNAAMIGALALGGWGAGLEGEALVRLLAWGALLGGGLQFLVQLPLALRLVGGLRPSLSTSVEGVREAIRNFTPVLAARGVVNLSGWLDYALAAFLATGAVAALGYAQTLYILPISLFGMSVAASELPELARRREGAAAEILGQEVGRGMERIAFFLVPSTLAYLVLGEVVVAALYQTGAFGGPEVLLTWGVLAAYAMGMGASASSRLLSSAFYALRDTRTPARVAYLRVALSLSVGAALMLPLDRVQVGEGLRLGAAGLALGASVGAWVELTLLRRSLKTSLGPHGPRRRVLVRFGLAGGAALLVGLGVRLGLAALFPPIHPILEALGVLGAFGGTYLVLTRVMGVGGSVVAFLPRRFRRGGP
jgi:putative peptidoglycan lipid II flippase